MAVVYFLEDRLKASVEQRIQRVDQKVDQALDLVDAKVQEMARSAHEAAVNKAMASSGGTIDGAHGWFVTEPSAESLSHLLAELDRVAVSAIT